MAFDGFVTHGIAAELNKKIAGGKIDKIHQPEKDEITISVRTREGLFRMVASAATSNPRLHLTELNRENPITAPLFCMILRKHLTGGKIKAVRQIGFDRIIRIDIECYTEMGDLTEKSLIAEIMGKHSNIILIQNDNKIIDCIKHIDFTTSAVRQVLPGLFYELPPSQNKSDPLVTDENIIFEDLKSAPSDMPLDKFLVSEFVGMSPLMAREIVYRKYSGARIFVCDADPYAFAVHTADFLKNNISNSDGGCVAVDKDTDKPVAFSCTELLQYTGIANLKKCPSLSQAVETFYAVRDMHDRLSQKSASTLKLVSNNIDRCEKKIALHTENIEKVQDREKYKIYGDLLTANLYRIQPNIQSIALENYYSENMDMVEIPLKPELSPVKNAQRYYKLYTKAKATEEHSKKQLCDAVAEKEYLETVLDAINRVATPADILEIREELQEQGYISAGKTKKKKARKKSAPLEFLSSDGYAILVGRNNKQNDELTIRTAYSTDMWLHTKQIPGSHVIIRTGGTGEVPDNTLVEAATIAAYYSKAQNATGVPVDYTLVKNIRKPNGSKPGFVIYETNYTVYVTPDEKLVEQLKKED